ncbi:hypothetical protein QBC47DRAFT_355705 [Echria macrotheca]|uniref:Uncharacterized protein n=1 Tax=Echria macrotheca TaxID=438768 RepID=A0AAJ0BNM6_9PEZI|nr:hypothetical protein QBC47DRAFT_355705 [Echria macrotheca]
MAITRTEDTKIKPRDRGNGYHSNFNGFIYKTPSPSRIGNGEYHAVMAPALASAHMISPSVEDVHVAVAATLAEQDVHAIIANADPVSRDRNLQELVSPEYWLGHLARGAVELEDNIFGGGPPDDGLEPEADFESIGVKNANVNTAEGVELERPSKALHRQRLVSLQRGRPSLKLLSLWEKDATFFSRRTRYPLRLVTYSRYEAPMHPIEMELHNRYTIKALKKARVIKSIVRIEIPRNSG